MGSQLIATGKNTAAKSSNSIEGSRLTSYLNFISTLTKSTPTYNVKMSAVSKIRQNFHEECEAMINKENQALHGFGKHFMEESGEERKHGIKLMEYQTKRGGRVVFQDIAKPSSMEWGSPADAMEAALELEKTVNQSLLDLHKCADSKGDAHLCGFLEAEYLGEQVDGIKSIGDWIIKIKRAGDGLGLHLIDKEIGS